MSDVRGFTLGSVHSSAHDIICQSVRQIVPQRNVNEIEVPGRDGTFDFGNPTYQKRIFQLNCSFKGTSLANLRTRARAIAAWASAATTLQFDDDPGIFWTGRISDSAELASKIFTGRFPLIFSAQPYAEDVTATTGTIDAAQDYGSAVEFYPTITVTKSSSTASSMQLTLLSTGELMLITDTIAAGDVLVFDMSTGKVAKNGTSCMSKLSIGSLPFGVPPGTQTITVTTTNTYTASISYRKRYL